MKRFQLIILMVVCMTISAQLYAQMKKSPHALIEPDHLLNYARGYYSQVFGFDVPGIFNPALYDTISEWLGTPYRYSGKNANGIDCSGFVNMIYNCVFGMTLSGNSNDLYRSAKRLSKRKLKEGDLVFFKIRHQKVSHVGLYLGTNKFAHSSRTNGVTISDLDDPYYRKYFAGGGRLK